MAISRKQRRYNRKKKAYLNKRTTVTLMPSRSVIPPSINVKLRYADYSQLECISGAYGDAFWRMNGIYDPNPTAVTDRPNYFDQLAGLYNNWCVYAAKMELYAAPDLSVTGSGTNIACSVLPITATAYSPSNLFEVMERPGSKTIMRNNYDGNRKLTIYQDCAKLLGITRKQYLGDEAYWGTSSSDPTTVLMFYVCGNAQNVTTSTKIDTNVKITYYVKFFDLKLVQNA